jgi:hypothetical protein
MTRSAPLRRATGEARLSVPVPVKRKCKACGEPFLTLKPLATACSPECAQELVAVAKAKSTAAAASADRKATREKLDAMRPLSHWVKQAQTAFNNYVRLRDITAGHGCIDCGKPFEPEKPGGSVDAGHYLSRGSAPHLKFDERNVFAQRKNCNRPGGATRADFRAGVLARIGLDAVEALESDQSVKQYRADDLKAITAEYRAKVRAIEKGRT